MAELEHLDGLAKRINEEHRRCECAVNAALEHAMNAGDLLLEAKAKAPHGTWQGWLEGNFVGSVRTAQAYMRVAARRGEVEAAKTQSAAPLSLDAALRALSTPRDAPEVGRPADTEQADERDDVVSPDPLSKTPTEAAWVVTLAASRAVRGVAPADAARVERPHVAARYIEQMADVAEWVGRLARELSFYVEERGQGR